MDGTKDPKDSSGATQDPSAGGGGTPKTPETFTKEQVQKSVSDALSGAGRDTKALEIREKELDARQQAVQSREADLAKWQKERDDVELEAAKDNPDLYDAIKLRRATKADQTKLAEDRVNLERDKAQHAAELEAAGATQREISIWEIASKQNVDASALKELSDDLNLQTTEQIERVARTMTPSQAITSVTGVTLGGVTGIEALAKANEDFAEGRITAKQLQEIRDQNK